MKTIISILAVFTLSFSAISQQVTEATEERVERVSKEEFNEKLETGEYIVFDVRTLEEYQAGHIKGAKLLDFLDGSFESLITTLPKNYQYLIYCQSGGRSASALQRMKEEGFTHVLELKGGYSSWQ